MALDTRFPAGMTGYLKCVYNDERSAWELALAARTGAGRGFVFRRFHRLETFFDKLDNQVGYILVAGRFYAF